MSTHNEQPTSIYRSPQYKTVVLGILVLPSLILAILLNLGVDTLLVLGGATFLALIAFMFVKPEATIFIVLFVMYANLTVVAKRSHNVPEIIVASFFLLLGIPLVYYLIVRREKILINPVLFIMIGYLGVLLISAALSGEPMQSADRISIYFLEGIVLYLLIINTVRSPEMLRLGIWALILAGLFMGSISIYQEMTRSYDNDLGGLAQVKEAEIGTGEEDFLGGKIKRRRLAGPLGSKNRYAQVMVVLLPLAITRIWAERSGKLRLLAAAACIPIAGGALLTFSRGAGVSIIATLLVMLALRVIRLWHFIAVALIGVVFVFVIVPDYVYRISTVVDVTDLFVGDVSSAGNSIQGRATENLASLNIFLDNPVIGVGPGQTKLYTAEYSNEIGISRIDEARRGHNMYLEELSDTGIIGFAVLMSIVIITMYQLWLLWRYWREGHSDIAFTAVGLLLAIIAYLATAVFLHLSYVRYFWLILALGGAAIEATRIINPRSLHAGDSASQEHAELG